MPSTNRYRAGVIGGGVGSAAGYAHYVASRIDGLWGWQTGVFSRRAARSLKSASIYGVSRDRAYRDVRQMLENEASQLDVVIVLSPTPDHAKTVQLCLSRGIPVICEKALAMTSAEARALQELCAEENGFLAVIYNYSGYPMVRELRSMIREGVLGEILHFQAEMPQEGFLRTDDKGSKPVPQDWRQKDGPVPTLHLDLAVHLHELIFYLTGEKPLEVVADQASRGWFPVIDNVSCLARYSNEVQGQLWFSKCALGHRNGLRLRIYGSKASAEWYQHNPEEVFVSFADGRRQILDRASNAKVASLPRYNRFKAGHPAGFNEALANLYADIHAALTGYKATARQESNEVFGADLAVEGLQFLEAMVRSCASRGWETVN